MLELAKPPSSNSLAERAAKALKDSDNDGPLAGVLFQYRLPTPQCKGKGSLVICETS